LNFSQYLCNIKRLLDGSLVQRAGEGITWTEEKECPKQSWWRSPAPPRPELQAHSLLFLIRIPSSDDAPGWNDIQKLVFAMKQFKFDGTHFDLMDRIVFGVPDAPSDIETFYDLVEKMNLPPLDTFPIVSAGESTHMVRRKSLKVIFLLNRIRKCL